MKTCPAEYRATSAWNRAVFLYFFRLLIPFCVFIQPPIPFTLFRQYTWCYNHYDYRRMYFQKNATNYHKNGTNLHKNTTSYYNNITTKMQQISTKTQRFTRKFILWHTFSKRQLNFTNIFYNFCKTTRPHASSDASSITLVIFFKSDFDSIDLLDRR